MKTMLVICTLILASAAGAAEYSDLYIIPVAGHARGAFGTAWRSDVVLHNVQAVPISVELVLVESGASPSAAPVALTPAALLLMPGETRTLPDVAGQLGRDITGALIVGADLPFAVTSRTWAERPGGRTLGQSVAPVAIGGAADAVSVTGVLPSLATTGQQRSNVGVFVAASHAPLVVEVTMLSPAGANLGSQFIVVDEPGFIHRQLPVPTAESSTAVVRIVEGDGIVVPYASTVDNTTAESLFVSGAPVAAQGAAARSMLLRSVTTTVAASAFLWSGGL